MSMVRQYRPLDLEDALKTMSEGVWIPFAGGTDLMIRARNWQGASRAMKGDVIFIQHLEALQQIVETDTHYRIGAGVTQAAFLRMSLLAGLCEGVSLSDGHTGDPKCGDHRRQCRQCGTGGRYIALVRRY
jgi:CO/xanthine dehydrogenase FAD-binding subunit